MNVAHEKKFRIWMPTERRMLYNPYVSQIFDGRDQINDFFNGKNNKYIWMQYIGMADKNEKDIYEGDILQSYNFSGDPYNICTVDNSLVSSCGCCATIHGWEIDFNSDSCVIGNIYENSDLLKEIK